MSNRPLEGIVQPELKNSPQYWRKQFSENAIQDLKARYAFPTDYDLASELCSSLSMQAALNNQMKYSFLLRNKEVHAQLKKLFDAAEKICELISGSMIFSLISTTSSKIPRVKKGGYPIINAQLIEQENKPKIALSFKDDGTAETITDPSLNMGAFIKDIAHFRNICLFAITSVKNDKGGRVKTHSMLVTPLICAFAEIYEKGTKKKPTCALDNFKEHHVGDFYYFLLDINNLLKSDLDLGEESTIGKNAIAALKTYEINKKSKLK